MNIKNEVEILKEAFETFLDNLTDVLKESKEPGVPTPPPSSVPAPPPPAPKVMVMTASANGGTREFMIAKGWTDAMLIEHGHMVEETTEAAPPSVPAPPSTGTASATMTPEQLNELVSAQVVRLGDTPAAEKKVKKSLAKHNNGASTLINLPVENYDALIAELKKLRK